MAVRDLVGRVSDVYYEFRFPGWNDARGRAEEVLPSNNRHEIRRILRNFASQVERHGQKPILSYSGILSSLGAAKSVQDLEQRCLVMSKMSDIFDAGAWWEACARGYISRYVEKALDILNEYGDFSLTYDYTPPKPYTYMATEEAEYGGTGVNAYYTETIEVEKTDYTNAELEVKISAP